MYIFIYLYFHVYNYIFINDIYIRLFDSAIHFNSVQLDDSIQFKDSFADASTRGCVAQRPSSPLFTSANFIESSN